MTAVQNVNSARYSVGKLTELGVLRFLALQIVAIFIGYLSFNLLDFNNPDGITVPPSIVSLLLFTAITIAGSLVLIFALDSWRVLTSTDWYVLGWGIVITMLLVIIWYRGIWLVSPYVTDSASDHFTYLQQSLIISDMGNGTWIPSTSNIAINAYSHTFLIAFLFRMLGQSGFLIIALQVIFVSWSAICLLHLFAARYRKFEPGLYADNTPKIALAFYVMPYTIFTAGIITKDTFVLFGISITLVAFYELNQRGFSLRIPIVLIVGLLITIISRLGHTIALLASFFVLTVLFRKKLKSIVLVSIIILGGGILTIWAAQSGMLAIYDQSTTGVLNTIVSSLRSGPLSYYPESSLIYRLSHPIGEGRLASLLSFPLAGAATWFIPFPFFFSDYRAVLHTSSALSNVASLAIFVGSFNPLKATFFRVLKNRSNFIDSLMLSFISFMFLAIALSATPLARYRLPFDWAMLYFFFSQRNLGRSIGLGLYVALLLVALSHLLYYAIS